ncbi:MAG: glycoside hydrolase family 3 C-terminal domain-containing protein [Bacteroidia bacterium]
MILRTKLLFTLFIFHSCSNLVMAQLDTKTETKIDSLIALMTLDEKVAMCHAQSKFSSKGVPRLGIPELWMTDGPHGVRGEINWDNWGYAGWTNDSITAFPALTCLAASFNPELAKAYGRALGEEALYRKKHVLLGPGVNIYRTPMNGRNFEYMGEDPYLASTLAVPYIQGVQENGVAACIKHYALNNQERWRAHINVLVSERALHEIYLPAFKASVIEGGSWSIMGAYNQYNGQYCCHNNVLLNQILKQDWEFDGVVITDWGGAHSTKEAALYGLDLEMGTGTDGLTSNTTNAYDYYYLAKPFKEAIEEGEIEEDVLNDKVRRILRLMFRTSMNKNNGFGRMNNKEHLDVARRVGTEGIVLLKNEKGFLPIDASTKKTIAVIGENATRMMTVGGGSSELKAKNEVSPLEGIRAKYKNANIKYAMGYASGRPMYARTEPSPFDEDSLRKAAVNMAKDADLVLFIGGLNKNHHQDCEGGDRRNFGLPFGQEKLLKELTKANKNVGVILVSGNAVEMPWLKDVEALMQAWYLGSEAGNALAQVISGDVNPSGKLPFSFPKKLEDNAAHAFGEISYPGDSIKQEYKEDILVGYRWHDTKSIDPLFEFGFGLSYSQFEITKAGIDQKTYSNNDKIKVKCQVSNIGKTNGAEVVQVYVGKTESMVNRAQKELKGYNKVYLEKGETKEVIIEIEISSLKYYSEKNHDWDLEKGNYEIYIGNSSRQIAQKLYFEVL